jgi:hypothetical protein
MVARVKRNGRAPSKIRTDNGGSTRIAPFRFKKGNPGRPPGIPNKLTREAKEHINNVFQRMGGEDAMLEWATRDDTHRTMFYVSIYPRLLPLKMSVDAPYTVTAEQATRKLEQLLLGNTKLIDVTPDRRDAEEDEPAAAAGHLRPRDQ